MWIFTRIGFFSAVCARKGDGKLSNPPDPDRLMIRARHKAHLDALLQRFPDLLKGIEIRESKNTDYRCRIFVAKETWARIMYALTLDTDYDNFKSATAKAQPKGHDYTQALHSVWSNMYRFQETQHGRGIYSGPKHDVGEYAVSTDVMAQEPEATEEVLVIKDQMTGETVGIIWYFEEAAYADEAEAYADAVKFEALALVAYPEYEHAPWQDVKDSTSAIFDPFPHTEEDEEEAGVEVEGD